MSRGWRGWNEVNTVRFDPKRITITRMEQVLREAGTYIKTLDGK